MERGEKERGGTSGLRGQSKATFFTAVMVPTRMSRIVTRGAAFPASPPASAPPAAGLAASGFAAAAAGGGLASPPPFWA